MGTYGISGLGAVRTEFPATYVPNCVTNDGLLLTRDDHLEVQVHLRYPSSVTKVTRWYTPGVGGRWGYGRYAHDFWGMNRREPIFLRDFKNWIARTIRAKYGATAVLIAPGVCVKTVWFKDGRRVDAAPYEAPPPPPAAADAPFGTGSGGPAPSGGTVAIPGVDWRTGLMDHLARRRAGAPPTFDVVGDSGGGGVDAGGGESVCSSGGGITAPPGTDPTGTEDVTAPPGTDAEGDAGEGAGEGTSASAFASMSPTTKSVVAVAAISAVAYGLWRIFKMGKAAKANRRRRNRRRARR